MWDIHNNGISFSHKRDSREFPLWHSGFKDPALPQLLQVAADAWIQSLTGELPYAVDGCGLKKKRLLLFATTWIEGITLSEVSQPKKNKYRVISYVESLKKKKKTELIESENRLIVPRGRNWGSGSRGGVGEIGEESQKLQTSSYKINKSWGYNIQHSDYS